MSMNERNKAITDEETGMSATENVEAAVRPYSRPQVLSAEDLEAVAAVCDPPVAGGPGKIVDGSPFNCQTLGS